MVQYEFLKAWLSAQARTERGASLVEYERVKKWNGEVPGVLIVGGNGATPIIDMSGLVRGKSK